MRPETVELPRRSRRDVGDAAERHDDAGRRRGTHAMPADHHQVGAVVGETLAQGCCRVEVVILRRRFARVRAPLGGGPRGCRRRYRRPPADRRPPFRKPWRRRRRAGNADAHRNGRRGARWSSEGGMAIREGVWPEAPSWPLSTVLPGPADEVRTSRPKMTSSTWPMWSMSISRQDRASAPPPGVVVVLNSTWARFLPVARRSSARVPCHRAVSHERRRQPGCQRWWWCEYSLISQMAIRIDRRRKAPSTRRDGVRRAWRRRSWWSAARVEFADQPWPRRGRGLGLLRSALRRQPGDSLRRPEFSLARLFASIASARPAVSMWPLAWMEPSIPASGSATCRFLPGFSRTEAFVDVGRSMLKRFQMEGFSLERPRVRDRLLLTY